MAKRQAVSAIRRREVIISRAFQRSTVELGRCWESFGGAAPRPAPARTGLTRRKMELGDGQACSRAQSSLGKGHEAQATDRAQSFGVFTRAALAHIDRRGPVVASYE